MMEAGLVLRFNAVLERFEPSCSSLSNAVMRMARIAWYEPLVSFGSKVSYRAEQGAVTLKKPPRPQSVELRSTSQRGKLNILTKLP